MNTFNNQITEVKSNDIPQWLQLIVTVNGVPSMIKLQSQIK